jgi:hypothetical protein
MQIERLTAVAPQRFATDYMSANRPVIVSDALAAWRLPELWTPEYFVRHFGDEKVQVYNSYFDLKSVKKLGAFIGERFNRADIRANAPYVRWYTKLREVEFFWADAAFAKISSNWSAPYFLPSSDYVFPFAPAPQSVDPTAHYFPARGLFMSERGAKTGLHVDPWGSDAVLCQLYGRKTWRMYAPDQAPLLQSGNDVVDIDNPDLARFPRATQVRPTYEFVLEAGESVYVPHGWFHTVHSDTDAISLTWNFVHRIGVAAFSQWLEQPRSKIDDEILSFFFSPAVGQQVTSESLQRLVSVHFGELREAEPVTPGAA